MQVGSSRPKRIEKRGAYLLLNIFFTIKIHSTFESITKQSKIVEPKQMISVTVSVNDGLDQVDFFAKELNSEFG